MGHPTLFCWIPKKNGLTLVGQPAEFAFFSLADDSDYCGGIGGGVGVAAFWK